MNNKQQIREKYGDLPNWLINLILVIGEAILTFFINKYKTK